MAAGGSCRAGKIVEIEFAPASWREHREPGESGVSDSAEIYFNPWDPVYRANPYPYYKPLHARGPFLMNLFVPFALSARYADAAAIIRDHQRFSSARLKGNVAFEPQQDLFGNAGTVLFSDPPTHTRLRGLASRAFTPMRIKNLEPRIREITATLLDRAESRGEFEVVADLATPLPVMVIAEMLGVPPEDYARFKSWSERIVERRNLPPGMPMPQPASSFRSCSAGSSTTSAMR